MAQKEIEALHPGMMNVDKIYLSGFEMLNRQDRAFLLILGLDECRALRGFCLFFAEYFSRLSAKESAQMLYPVCAAFAYAFYR